MTSAPSCGTPRPRWVQGPGGQVLEEDTACDILQNHLSVDRTTGTATLSRLGEEGPTKRPSNGSGSWRRRSALHRSSVSGRGGAGSALRHRRSNSLQWVPELRMCRVLPRIAWRPDAFAGLDRRTIEIPDRPGGAAWRQDLIDRMRGGRSAYSKALCQELGGRWDDEEGSVAAKVRAVAKAAGVAVTAVSRFPNGGLDLPERVRAQIGRSISGLSDRCTSGLLQPSLPFASRCVNPRRTLALLFEPDWPSAGARRLREAFPVTLVERDSVAPPTR